MKKILTVLLATTMIASTALIGGCGSQSGNSSSNSSSSKSSSSKSSSASTVEGNFPYKSIDVKQFDKTKFDGKIKMTNGANESSQYYESFGDFSFPLNFKDFEKYDYTDIDDDDYESTIRPHSFSNAVIHSDYNKNHSGENISMFMIRAYNPSDEKVTVKEAVNKNWFGLYDNSFGISGLEKDFNITDIKDGIYKQHNVLLNNFGVPTEIIATTKDGEYADTSYIYKYDECTLVFKFKECDYSIKPDDQCATLESVFCIPEEATEIYEEDAKGTSDYTTDIVK